MGLSFHKSGMICQKWYEAKYIVINEAPSQQESAHSTKAASLYSQFTGRYKA